MQPIVVAWAIPVITAFRFDVVAGQLLGVAQKLRSKYDIRDMSGCAALSLTHPSAGPSGPASCLRGGAMLTRKHIELVCQVAEIIRLIGAILEAAGSAKRPRE